jgi:methylated-DNA-[protein]-cysteine S-methyltransferase
MNEIEKRLIQTRPNAEPPIAEFIERAEEKGLVDVAYALVDSPVGSLVAAATQRGLVRLSYAGGDDLDGIVEDLARRISPRILESPSRLDEVRRELDEYFEQKRTDFDVPLDWRLTHGFTRKVLRATARVPYGDVTTYKTIARRAGSERAVRAAGNALGANPIPIVVPCHRVLQTGGALGGYTGGIERKQFLLELEGALG